MNCKIMLLSLFLLLLLGSASAVYELCDSIERDDNGSVFKCIITTPKIAFTQQDIDNFWQNMQEDGGFTAGRIKTVEWIINQTVVQYSDDVRFLQMPGMSLNWDIYLEGGSPASLDINTAASTPGDRPGNQTAIKKRVTSIGTGYEYLLSFAPMSGRRSVRHISMAKPADGLAVYISGSNINKAEMELEGNLTLSGAYVENVKDLKAKEISISERGSIRDAESIDAKSISLDGESYIRGVGAYSMPAISTEEGLTLEDGSWIENLLGGLDVTGDISITESSRLENLSVLESESIQWINAGNLTLNEGKIRGFGGQPGSISLTGNLAMDNGQIIGKESYKPKILEAQGISMANDSVIQHFTKKIKAGGKAQFSLESGSIIKNFSGEIESCATLKLDGNATRIVLDSKGTKKIEARAIELDGNAEIACTGQEECEYNFVQLECGTMPTVELDVNGSFMGEAPFPVSFVGSCDGQGTEVTCTIAFGDGSLEEAFNGSITHVYQQPGDYSAWLTATNGAGQTAKVEKLISVTGSGVAPPTGPAVKMTLSSQAAKKGEDILVNITCNADFETFKLENSFGLPAIETVPKACPVSLGPFKIPKSLEPGKYNFSVAGTTKSGQAFKQTAVFTVEEDSFPFADLEAIIPYAAAAGLLIVACIVTIAILNKKRKGHKAKGPAPKAGIAQGKPPEKPKPQSPAPWIRSSESRGEKPPWLMHGGAIISSQPAAPKPTQNPMQATQPRQVQPKATSEQPMQPKQVQAQPKAAQPPAKTPVVQAIPLGTERPAGAPQPARKRTNVDEIITELETVQRGKMEKGMQKNAIGQGETTQPAIAPITGTAGPKPAEKALAEPERKEALPDTHKKKGLKMPSFAFLKRKKKEPTAIKETKPAKAAENLFGKPEPEKKTGLGWLKKKREPTAGEKLFGKELPSEPKAFNQPKPANPIKPAKSPKQAQPKPNAKAKQAMPQSNSPKTIKNGKKPGLSWFRAKKSEEPKPAKKVPGGVPAWLKKVEEEDQ